jgi:methanogenic corrinoid protein MtbC1
MPSRNTVTVATTMAELTLSEAGWSVTNLGPDNPAETLVEAIVTLRPRLLCLGISVVHDVNGFAAKYAMIADSARQHRAAVVIGGVAATTEVRAKIRYAACCASMRELADFATSLEPTRVRD